MSALRIAVAASDAEAGALVRDAIAAVLPASEVRLVEEGEGEAMARVEAVGDRAATIDEGRRALAAAQRLLGLGDLARSVQHAANNPLGAILAEAQLLEMDDSLAPDHAEAVRRIIALSRRLAETLRQLDAARPDRVH
jgi:light-regulated signal transduction histidine kinase (bacteriophytochrome)